MKSPKDLSVGFLFDDTLDSTAGVAQYVKTVGAWLASQGHRTFYMVGETKLDKWAGGQVYSLSKNVGVRFNGNRLSTPLPTFRRSTVRQILAREKPDILHVQVPYSPFMAQRVINCADDSTAVVGTFCILPVGQSARLGTRLLRYVYGRSLKRIEPMLAVSSAAADFAEQALGVKSQILPNVINLKNFKPAQKSRTTRQRPRIVFLGRLVERKGAYQLLEAFNLLHQRLPETELVLAGDGPQKNILKSYVKKHKLENYVSFPGFIDESQKAAVLASADVACFPSLSGESFGISLLEGMAVGSAVVLGGDNPGYQSVLGKQPDTLVKPSDTQVFANRLEKLLIDKALRAQLLEWQTAEVKQYDIDHVGPQLVEVYRRAIAKRRSSL